MEALLSKDAENEALISGPTFYFDIALSQLIPILLPLVEYTKLGIIFEHTEYYVARPSD